MSAGRGRAGGKNIESFDEFHGAAAVFWGI
jgi:hypothetical protein